MAIKYDNDTRKLTISIYKTGSEKRSVGGWTMISGSGNVHFGAEDTKGKDEVVVFTLCEILHNYVKAANMIIMFETNSEWFKKQLGPDGEYRKLGKAGFIAKYGRPAGELMERLDKELRARNNTLKLAAEPSVQGMAHAKAESYIRLQALKALEKDAAAEGGEEIA